MLWDPEEANPDVACGGGQRGLPGGDRPERPEVAYCRVNARCGQWHGQRCGLSRSSVLGYVNLCAWVCLGVRQTESPQRGRSGRRAWAGTSYIHEALGKELSN